MDALGIGNAKEKSLVDAYRSVSDFAALGLRLTMG